MSIRQRLLLFLILVAAIPVAIAGVLSYGTAERALSTAVEALHTRSAQAEAEYAGAYVLSFGEELALALAYEDPSALSPADVQEFLTRLYLRRDRISTAALLLPTGNVQDAVFVDDPEAFARQEPQFRLHDTVTAEEAQDFYERAAALLQGPTDARRFAVSAPYRTRHRGRPAIAVVAHAPPGQQLSLAAELMLDELAVHLSRAAEGTRAYLLDRDGNTFLTAGDGTAAPAAMPELAGRERGGIIEFTHAGVAFQAAHSPVERFGWTAVVARPRDLATAPLRELFRSSGFAMLAAILLVAVLAPVLSRALASPIAALVQGALEFSRGNLSHRISLPRQDELGRLASTFNEMGQSIQRANAQLVRFNEELQAQVEERTKELKLAQQQLLRSQRLAAVGDLSAGLAHEVNNPLSAIVGNTQLLLMELPAEDPARPMLGDVLDQALRISDIVRDLQALSEAQRGGLSPVDLHQVIERAVTTKNGELGKVDIVKNFATHPPVVLGDEPALREVFGHLLSNAVNAVADRETPHISLTTSTIEDQAVMVEVTDNGRGIPKENLERIFNPFFTTKQSWAGRGLALAICHRVVENHGGKISIQSELDVGTTVTVVFPAAPPKPHLR